MQLTIDNNHNTIQMDTPMDRYGNFKYKICAVASCSTLASTEQTVISPPVLSTCPVDYCNSLLFDIGAERIKRLQSIQNAAARLVSGTRKFDRITIHACTAEFALAACSQVHRVQDGDVGPQLPERESAVLSGRCLHPRRHTTRTSTAPFCCRSSAVGPRTSTNIGRRGFHCCGPARPTWNALPVSLRTDNRSSDAFGRALKRHLFSI